MATVRKTITVTAKQGEWIKARITKGDFTNDSEYIRDLIRRDQQRNLEIESIRAALEAGEESGTSDKTVEDIINAAKVKLREDGKI